MWEVNLPVVRSEFARCGDGHVNLGSGSAKCGEYICQLGLGRSEFARCGDGIYQIWGVSLSYVGSQFARYGGQFARCEE